MLTPEEVEKRGIERCAQKLGPRWKKILGERKELEDALRLTMREAKACPLHYFRGSGLAINHAKDCEDCEAVLLVCLMYTISVREERIRKTT